MRKLSSLILLLALSVSLFSQKSPHGEGFKTNCTNCHNTSGWKIDLKKLSFDHSTTKFPLTGQHQAVTCKLCHTSLEFSKVGKECISCHTDMHNQTVGSDCERCHTPVSWVVNNITEIHQRSRFPLVGAHVTADCFDCHTNATSNLLLFGPLGIECVDCHMDEYTATTNPNHVAGAYSTNCTQCHNMSAFSWTGAGINHNFFPLTGGHEINNCQECHKTPDYSSTSPECISCHQADYNATTNPSHTILNFSTNCNDCHTTDPGWKPAEYREHDAKSFPIYSGKHNGEWSNCNECHPNAASYAQFTCTDCHEHNQSDMNGEHEGVQGYVYNSPACLACHPTGSSEGTFNHSASAFPLTGAHLTTDCIACHSNGYIGTSTVCFNCHTENFNQTTNPNHAAINITTECESCHTTQPGWKPATFPTHNNYFQLEGAHMPIANSCNDCHNGNYNETPNTCAGCHLEAHNQTTNPPHVASQFPTTCADCHTQNVWSPANWDHDNLYFPIYSGNHNGEWIVCSDCHPSQGNFQDFTCTAACHPQPEMNNEHQGVGGYLYNNAACYSCHPTGSAEGTFNHNTSGFPLTGAHITTQCIQCHPNGYTGTSTVCFSCHGQDYNQTTNPNHAAINIPTDCNTCHTTNPNWVPATFPIHNNYYVLAGAHTAIANNCAECHNGNYNSTPNTCVGCHLDDYNQTTNPPHAASQFPTSCLDCHTQNGWTPATWDHDNLYFPIYSGEHEGEWDACSDCHPNPGNYALFTCTTACHPQSEMNNEHQGVSGYSYTSTACLNCHPDGGSSKMMNKINKND